MLKRHQTSPHVFLLADPERPNAPPPPPDAVVLANAPTVDDMAAGKYSKAKPTSGKKNRLNKRRIYARGGGGDGYATFPVQYEKRASVASEAPLPIRVCEAVLSNTTVRVNLYLIGGLAFSILGEYLSDYQHYFYTAQPKNVFNEYFVKFGWGWTLGLVLPFSLLCGAAFRQWQGAFSAAFRCAVATAVWFGFTKGFDLLREGLDVDFDISGHSFILIWSNMFLVEEGKAYQGWEKVRAASKIGTASSRPLLDWFLWPARILLLSMAALSVLWDVMYFSTVLFFHTWEEKVVAIALALFVWWLIYRGLYGTMPLLPDRPSRQVQKEMKTVETEQTGTVQL